MTPSRFDQDTRIALFSFSSNTLLGSIELNDDGLIDAFAPGGALLGTFDYEDDAVNAIDELPIEVDYTQLKIFVQALFKHAQPDNWVSLRIFHDGREAPPVRINPIKFNGDLKILIDRAFSDAKLAASSPEKLVFCPPIATFNNSKRARQEDLAEGMALSIECDKAARAARAKLEAVLGRATLVVASGGYTIDKGEIEQKLHIHHRLKVPTRSKEEHRMLKEARRLAAMLVGADRSNVPVVHPIRWPGSLRRKGTPTLCGIFAHNPDAEIDLAWALERLREAVKAEGLAPSGSGAKDNRKIDVTIASAFARLEPVSPAEGTEGPSNPNNLRAPCIEAVISVLAAIPNDELEWVYWNYVGLAAWGATAGSAAGGEAFATWSAKSKKNDPAVTQARWEHYATSPPNRIGYGTLVYLARKFEPDWEPPTVTDEKGAAKAPLHSEEALALAFAERHADTLRHVAKWGRWLVWDGTCWRTDDTRKVFSLARELCRETAAEASSRAERKRIASAKTRAAVVSLASEDRRLAATVEQWDTDPWLLNTPGGVVDLRTGTLREHRITDYMTKQTAVTPPPVFAEASCPRWKKFMETVTGGDSELQRYLQRMSGYCLTGETIEQELYFFYGSGNNGKGVWVKTIAKIWRDYHCTTSIETFTVAQFERHPTELAVLVGARLVTASETEEGRRWSESRIKDVTGGDEITARFMRADPFDFTPQFKPLFSGQHMPKLRTVNKAITRRFNRIPFAVTIPEDKVNKNLADELAEEWPGILAWAIEGCLEWQRIGMCPPQAVTDSTESYLESEDVLGEWIIECCICDDNAWESSKNLFGSWKGWAGTREEWVGSEKDFTNKLEDRGGFKRHKNKEQTKRGFVGLRLKTPAETTKANTGAPSASTRAGSGEDENDPDVAKLLSFPKGQPVK